MIFISCLFVCGLLQLLKNIKCPDNVLTKAMFIGPHFTGWSNSSALSGLEMDQTFQRWQGRDEHLTTLEDESTKIELLLLVSYSNCFD